MPLEPETTTEMRQFQGQMSNVDEHDLPPGAAQEQENMVILRANELSVRLGMKKVSWEN